MQQVQISGEIENLVERTTGSIGAGDADGVDIDIGGGASGAATELEAIFIRSEVGDGEVVEENDGGSSSSADVRSHADSHSTPGAIWSDGNGGAVPEIGTEINVAGLVVRGAEKPSAAPFMRKSHSAVRD